MRSLQFLRVLGSGAFGSVYLADLVGDRGFRRQVAVKVLLHEQANGEMFMSRVRDEARLLGLLADDHILKVLELLKVEGRDAVLMEYVEGVDLAALVECGFRPPPRALAELGAAVAGALHRAHRAVHPNSGEPLNVIHRDVKPANVMLTSRGNVKLLDFGVARARFESRESHTGQFVLGTLNYMAPEYIVTGEVSPAADIYGLALTLWEAACGEVFGQPKLRQDLHEARVEERLAVISGSHAELVPVLRQMLAWDPRARPDGAAIERAFMAATDMLRGTGLRTWSGDCVPQVVAKEREAARDEVGLLNKTVQLGEAEPTAPAVDEQTQHRAQRAPFLDAPPPPAASPARASGAPPPAASPGPSAAAKAPAPAAAKGPAPTAAKAPAPAAAKAPAPAAAKAPPPAAKAASAKAPAGGTDPRLPAAGATNPRAPAGRAGARPSKRSQGNMLLLQGLIIGSGFSFFCLLVLGVILLLRGFR
jgi:serine/threonine-protein kinase